MTDAPASDDVVVDEPCVDATDLVEVEVELELEDDPYEEVIVDLRSIADDDLWLN